MENPSAIVPDQPYDKFGVEYPRITKIGDTYYICYTSIAKGLGERDTASGVRVALASTKDFKTFKKHGVIGPDRTSKAGAIFESGGRVHFMWKDEAGIERTMLSPAPADFENAETWRNFWEAREIEDDVLVAPQLNDYEDFGIEPGAPPIEIEEGLLIVYCSISSDHKWSISLMLLDKNEPTAILAKTTVPVLRPEKPYELSGDVNNVVFPYGAVVANDRLYVYYAAADTVCAVASESMDNIRRALAPFTDNRARINSVQHLS